MERHGVVAVVRHDPARQVAATTTRARTCAGDDVVDARAGAQLEEPLERPANIGRPHGRTGRIADPRAHPEDVGAAIRARTRQRDGEVGDQLGAV